MPKIEVFCSVFFGRCTC